MRPFTLCLTAALSLAASLSCPADGGAARGGWVETPYGRTRIAFADHFEVLHLGPGQTWGWKTAAYRDGCIENPDDFKLDHLTPDALRIEGGNLVITGRPGAHGRWDTGLATTGDSCESGGSGAEVRTGDFLLAHLRLPAADTGAWPALWTWREGRNEVDVFEWHADRPHTLEFVNQVRSGTGRYESDRVTAGGWLYVGVRFGADNTTWYVGTERDRLTVAFEDKTGVGPDFAAYPVLSLSINNGVYHPAPPGNEVVHLAISGIDVYRPAPPDLPTK